MQHRNSDDQSCNSKIQHQFLPDWLSRLSQFVKVNLSLSLPLTQSHTICVTSTSNLLLVLFITTILRFISILSILVSLGCHNKTPQTGWFKDQKFTSHKLRSPKSKCKPPRFLVRLSSWLADSWIPTVSSYGRESSALSHLLYMHACVYACVLSYVQLFETLRTVAHQARLSMSFPRQEYWSG